MVDEDWLKVALNAMALGIGLYLIPLAMIANPALIGLADAPVSAVLAMIKTGLGLTATSFGIVAPGSRWTGTALILAGAALLFAPVPLPG